MSTEVRLLVVERWLRGISGDRPAADQILAAGLFCRNEAAWPLIQRHYPKGDPFRNVIAEHVLELRRREEP